MKSDLAVIDDTERRLPTSSIIDEGLAEVIYAGDGNTGTTKIPTELEDDPHDAVDGCPTDSIKLAHAPK